MCSLYLGENLISGNKPINLGVRNIGEIVASSLPLTDAGLHLLDGSLILGGGIYQGFVDYIADLYDNSAKVSNVTKVGSLTDNNGVLSGFSFNNWVQTPIPLNLNNNTWEMVYKIHTANDVTTAQAITGEEGTESYQNVILIEDAFFKIEFSTTHTSYDIYSAGTYTVLPNTDYWVKISFNGSAYVLQYSTDGENYTTDITINNSYSLPNAIWRIGRAYWQSTQSPDYSEPFLGTIDLKECYVDISNSRYWTGVHHSWATDEAEWQQSVTTYGVCGKFVYDSINNTVRLPKITGIIEGTVDVSALGDLVEAGLPNITGGFSELFSMGAYDVFASNSGSWRAHGGGDSGMTNASCTFDASRSSSIYGNSSTVQPQTIKAFYYIVIANSTKTEIQSDIDEIATDLNGKADVDLSNVNASQGAKNTIIGWGMPDYANKISFSDNTKIQVPVDALVSVGNSNLGAGVAGANLWIYDTDGTTEIWYSGNTATYASAVNVYVPKGLYVKAEIYGSIQFRQFIPLKGAN